LHHIHIYRALRKSLVNHKKIFRAVISNIQNQSTMFNYSKCGSVQSKQNQQSTLKIFNPKLRAIIETPLRYHRGLLPLFSANSKNKFLFFFFFSFPCLISRLYNHQYSFIPPRSIPFLITDAPCLSFLPINYLSDKTLQVILLFLIRNYLSDKTLQIIHLFLCSELVRR